jgi:ATP-GRASP peptide maturase of grasp-with-spasm system
MILILSTPFDSDTLVVIDWLRFNNASFFRLNDEDLISGEVEFFFNVKQISESYIMQNNKTIFFKDIKIVWFRKFGFLKTYEDEFGKNTDLVKYLYSEFNVLKNIIFDLLKEKEWLFNRNNMPSKLRVLEIATKYKLKIPETVITSSKIKLSVFLDNNNNSILSKSLGDGKNIEFKGDIFSFYTKRINSIDGLDDKFSPSVFQKYIDKLYELRIFYLDGSFFSMVIFSQTNPKTIDDFRNYDDQNPNRYEPYNLPKTIEVKLNKMMRKLGLNTGSIDMIKAKDGNYYFLEVNPSGQFGMTSVPCNYPLHELVANYLISKST